MSLGAVNVFGMWFVKGTFFMFIILLKNIIPIYAFLFGLHGST